MVGRNTNVESNSGEGSEGSGKHGRESFHHLKEHMHHHEQNIGRNMKITSASGEVWEKIFICLLGFTLVEKRTK